MSESAAASTPILVAEAVSKRFPPPAEVDALRAVSFELAPGELAALVGPSGSGKSTLLSVVGGLMTPTSGRVRVAGAELPALSPAARARARCERIGFVFQFHHLLPELTALENAALPAIVAAREGWRRETLASINSRAHALLASVGLEDRAGHFPTQLSGGEAQRVALARALANEPAVVLADEPTGNLDAKTASDLMDLVQRLNREAGVTFLIATHNPELVGRASRVLRLVNGELTK
jgi:lipoprotein-releasing system ATP-binding protein